MGLFGGVKRECSKCQRKTSQVFEDCWDPEVGDDDYRHWSDVHNCWMYVRLSYYRCKKCGTQNTFKSYEMGD